MANLSIPPELVEKLAERRVIPFIGAGFSSSLRFPNWLELLQRIYQELDLPDSFDKLHSDCGDDPLQTAEYLWIMAHQKNGRLRQIMSEAMNVPPDIVARSTPHVELVNFGAQSVYTTNYDLAIERTFKALGVDASVIAIPHDLATTRPDIPQVVKFHGDLRHDESLVLTQSSYHKRLDFETPIDLKFRADLIGKSVLFMGYSLRDVNIRVIWFRLMEMMHDVPIEDRPRSYIVRFEPNEALQTLYAHVGIKTITLDPESRTIGDSDAKRQLFDDFMIDLSLGLDSKAKIPGTRRPMFVSAGLLARVSEDFAKAPEFVRTDPRNGYFLDEGGSVGHLSERVLPGALVPRAEELLDTLPTRRSRAITKFALQVISLAGIKPSVVRWILMALLESGRRTELSVLNDEQWSNVWSHVLDSQHLDAVIMAAVVRCSRIVGEDPEEQFQGRAYAFELMMRIKTGRLGSPGERVGSWLEDPIDDLVNDERMNRLNWTGAPHVDDLVEALREREGPPKRPRESTAARKQALPT